MNKYTAIFLNDMKNTRRDPTLIVLLFVPLLLILATRYGLPPATEVWPLLSGYPLLIVSFFCVLTAMMPAFLLSFMLLDERDQHVLLAIRTMPVTPGKFFLTRMLFMLIFGFAGCFLLLQLNGVVEIAIFKSLVISLVCAVCSPFFVFLTISFAKNKIEGATIMKVLNVLLILPMIGLFVDNPLTYILGLIPFFWIYEGFEVIDQPANFFLYFGVGLIIAITVNMAFYKLALRRFYLK